MAVVHYDPSIEGFTNRLGNLVYYRNRETKCVRRWVMPRNPRTELQQRGRRSFADAVKLWQNLEPYRKAQWNRKALIRHISGYNLFISEHMKTSREDEREAVTVHSSFVRKDPLRSRPVSSPNIVRRKKRNAISADGG